MRDVLGRLVSALEMGRDVAICQIVATRGSTPQKAGALMLLEPDGSQVGTLGGGCVEAEVKRKAAGLIGQDGPELLRFVLDHDPSWADGLICGGRMVVLAECPRGDRPLAYYRAYRDRIEAGSGVTEAIAIDGESAGNSAPGDRFLLDHEGRVLASLASAVEPPSGVEPPIERRKPSESAGWAFLPTAPRVRLVIVGAGHVGQAVSALATRADFGVWVVDDRPEYASADRFPDARRRLIGPIGEVLSDLEMTASTYALIVTRGHGHDQEALALLAPTAASYVGMIGSRRKIRRIFDALRDEGVSDEVLSRVAAPVGLEIGSETVDEIAVSIVAELIARRNLGPEAFRALRAAGRRE